MNCRVGFLFLLLAGGVPTRSGAADPPASTNVASARPTLVNVAYGNHARQVLDLWQASATRPTPVLLHFHGGGWVGGDKARDVRFERYLAAGISVVSVNYRFVTQAILADIEPPVKWPLEDAVRALQFVRSRAKEWNLDPVRVGAFGTSAGAYSSLYLALVDEQEDPNADDPVARQSTRLWCVAGIGAQTTLDPRQMQQWTPNSRYGGHAFGFMPNPRDVTTRDSQFAPFLAAREKLLPWIRRYSPFEHASAGDPPVYLIYATPPAPGHDEKDPTHTANFGVLLQERLHAAGGECELVYPGARGVKHPQVEDFLIAKLLAGPSRARRRTPAQNSPPRRPRRGQRVSRK